MLALLTEYLHYLSFMILFGALLAEHLMFKPPLTDTQVQRLFRVDVLYGISAMMVLVTGTLRLIYFEKPLQYYLHNHFFWAKITCFLIVGLLSIYPTVKFISWHGSVKKKHSPELSEEIKKRVLWLLRIEVGIALFIPLFAVLMAAGI